jgi:hypothetical protein
MALEKQISRAEDGHPFDPRPAVTYLDSKTAPNAASSSVQLIYYKDDAPLCSERSALCRACGWRPEDHYQVNCPECHNLMICMNSVKEPGLRCRVHGGDEIHALQARREQRALQRADALPARVRAAYVQALQDPELFNLRPDLATIEARIADLMTRVDFGEAGRIWQQAQTTFIQFQDAVARDDTQTMRVHLQTLGRLLAKGATDYTAWSEIIGLIEQRRRLIDTEMRRLEKMRQFLTAEEVHRLVDQIAELAKRVIKDPKVLNVFTIELAKLLD